MDRFYQSLPALAGFAVFVAPALKPTHEARRRGGDSIARLDALLLEITT
ncbi:hypothetical protein [Lelliottia sp.]